ncbi:unnamed protein product [Peronospora effusa]|uniref:Uncharacterized protein n=1 Tax=Peronospora effusa TaxID=542832 RepID=A0A3M6VKC3_9STRA|nr:hypothetical protein DD238_004826 [Peronospora effusa]RQM16326.1 hypothetical protein DD237_003880 [Peronospora effusa]CAI5705711.1 unnamed protein product [Peronospora effusa]
MVPTTTQAFEVFSERDQIHGNLSILTYTEEEEVQDYFDAEWDEQDVDVITPLAPNPSEDATWDSCTTSDSSSVLGGCTTPPATSMKVMSRRKSYPLLNSLCETHSLSKVSSMPPLYRPSELGIGLTSIVGDPRGNKNIRRKMS